MACSIFCSVFWQKLSPLHPFQECFKGKKLSPGSPGVPGREPGAGNQAEAKRQGKIPVLQNPDHAHPGRRKLGKEKRVKTLRRILLLRGRSRVRKRRGSWCSRRSLAASGQEREKGNFPDIFKFFYVPGIAPAGTGTDLPVPGEGTNRRDFSWFRNRQRRLEILTEAFFFPREWSGAAGNGTDP